ncbi:hypothetical protein SAMN05192583_3162 [Sphingomonas gellani]|uniref:Uncharacterized protein n=1 Tax=Sphingomonas gellani TaxID=1166340 RepID=A0A1H8I0W3_9SPHN|nr:hypothetical protein SAMN05192583_3162 [Sphingomonas gellani]
MLNGLWRKPARLWRGQKEAAHVGTSSELVSEGSLEDMIRVAAQASPAEKPFLLIACDALEQPLSWPQFETLRKAPEFPIDI